MTRRPIRSLAPAALALGCAAPASAQLTTFTDRSAWEAALTSFQTETFSLPQQTNLAGNTLHPLGLIDFSFVGTGGFLPAILNNAFVGDPNVPDFGGGTTAPGPHTFALPLSVNAVGGDFQNVDILSLTIGAETINIPTATSFDTFEFFGVISAAPFSSFVIDAIPDLGQINDNFVLDNLSFGTAVSSLPGDANGDGVVDLLDFDVLAQNFGTGPGATGGVGIGDFNEDGNVDLLDFDILAQNFGATSPATVPGTVPEPASFALLGLAGPMLFRGRGRRRR